MFTSTSMQSLLGAKGVIVRLHDFVLHSLLFKCCFLLRTKVCENDQHMNPENRISQELVFKHT